MASPHSSGKAIKKRAHLLLLAAVLFLAALARLAFLGHKSMWYDELYSIWARKLPVSELIPDVIAAGHPPVFNMLGHYWYVLGGSEFAVRSLSSLSGVAAVLLIYLCGKELFSRWVALTAAALAAASPFLVWYSREATSYSWLTFIVLLSLYTLLICCRKNKTRHWVLYTIVTAVALYSHYYTLVLLAAEIPVYLLLGDRSRRGLVRWGTSQLVLVAVLASSLIAKQLGSQPVAPMNLPPFDGFVDTMRNVPLSLVLGPAGSLWLSSLVAWLAAVALLGILLSYKNSRRLLLDRRFAAVGLFTGIMVLGPVIFSSSMFPVVSSRYYVWATPAFLLLLAALAFTVKPKLAAGMILIVLAALSVETLKDTKLNQAWDMRSVMAVLANEQQPGDRVVCFPEHHCIVAADFYLAQQPSFIGGFLVDASGSSVYMWPKGENWHGYRTGFWDGQANGDQAEMISGEKLRKRLNDDLQNTDRVWLFSGDGSNDIFRAYSVEIILSEDWVRTKQCDFPPFLLSLYTRRNLPFSALLAALRET